MNIVILGPQGSGKTTQADLLAKKMGFHRLSAGDVSRDLMGQDTSEGHRAKEAMLAGELVPDDIIIPAFAKVLTRPEFATGVVIDGYPRNVYEATHSPFPIDKVIYLKVSRETSVCRMVARGRADDTPELINAHLEVYHRETEPVLDYYRQLGVLTEVNGEPSEQEIFSEILNKLRLTA